MISLATLLLLFGAPLQERVAEPTTVIDAVTPVHDAALWSRLRALTMGTSPDTRASGDGFTSCQEGGLCEISGCR